MKSSLALCTALSLFAPLLLAAENPAIGKLRTFFPSADADRNGVLSAEEQGKALAYVKQTYGEEWEAKVKGMLAGAATGDGTVTADGWKKQVDRLAQPVTKRTEMLPMRDGKRLATDIYLPPGDGPFPVILARTPYGRVKHNESAEGFAAAGYAFVNQDMRGRFDSEGENVPFIGCGWGEHQDGVDTVKWIQQQPWCSGKIGTIGGSAGGITQNYLAGALQGALEAQYIRVAPSDMYSDVNYIGGAFRKADVEGWSTHNKYDPLALATNRAHPSYDDYWRANDTHTKFAVMDVPAVIVGGWFDMFAQGTLDQFVGRQHEGAPGSKGKQKLVMGPWQHATGEMPVGQLTFPNANRIPAKYDPARWFEHYLQRADNGVDREPAVAYYVMGDTSKPGAPGNEWRYADDWPIPAKETPVYLTGEKGLSLKAPGAGGLYNEYTFDPENPCPTRGGMNLMIDRGSFDQRKSEERPDVVVFTSPVLDKPVEVTGRLWAKLFVSSSAVDTDLSVRICDVYPDGRSMLMAEGMQRLRYRASREKPELLTPGKVEEVTVDCWSTSVIFNAGHRVRVAITSSNYPRFDVNPGTGQPWSDDGAKVKQTNRIYCDAEHPSRLVVPMPER